MEVLTQSTPMSPQIWHKPDLRRVVVVGVFEDHLDPGAGGVRGLGQRANLVLNVIPLTAARLADVDDHVEFGGAVVERLFDLGELDRSGVASVGKADGGAGLHRASGEQRGAARRVIRQNADAGHVVAQRQLASGLEFRHGERRVQQRVVDHLGDVGIREVDAHV